MGTHQVNELTRNYSERACPQLSQFAEPLWTDPGLKKKKNGGGGVGVHELSPLKKKKLRLEMIRRIFRSNHRKATIITSHTDLR